MPTLIVRLWTPAPELATEVTSAELHGSIERVGEDGASYFRSTRELVEILEELLAAQRRETLAD